MLALSTGQRQGDLLRLTWSNYDGEWIRIRQSKTGRRVMIPVFQPLKMALDSIAKESPMILLNSEKKPWTSDGFRTSWGKACKKAKITGLTFHDLRRTAATRLKKVGCTVEEITGHSIKEVTSILETHYLASAPKLALSAIRKLETNRKL